MAKRKQTKRLKSQKGKSIWKGIRRVASVALPLAVGTYMYKNTTPPKRITNSLYNSRYIPDFHDWVRVDKDKFL